MLLKMANRTRFAPLSHSASKSDGQRAGFRVLKDEMVCLAYSPNLSAIGLLRPPKRNYILQWICGVSLRCQRDLSQANHFNGHLYGILQARVVKSLGSAGSKEAYDKLNFFQNYAGPMSMSYEKETEAVNHLLKEPKDTDLPNCLLHPAFDNPRKSWQRRRLSLKSL